MKRTLSRIFIMTATAFVSLASTAEDQTKSAIAVLMPTEGNEVSGVVTFNQTTKGMEISAVVEGLAPGKHGFHIHEFGDCSGPDGKTAGGHFNPHQEKHAGPEVEHRHIGDLGNLEANQAGKAEYQHLDQLLSFSGPNNIIGRSVIVHAGADDLVSQPTGGAGGRVACGVIGVKQKQ